jgi:leader peptidase (prepilin peptidase) / N-methyltransferase
MIEIAVYVSMVVLGLALGSFVNALVWRMYMRDYAPKKALPKVVTHRDLSVTRGRSMCTHCGHQLAARDLVPVVSWLTLRGKCRYCGKRIADTPFAELLVPALFVLSYWAWPYSFVGVYMAVFLLWLAAIVVLVALLKFDNTAWMLLPDKLTWTFAGIATAISLLRATDLGASSLLVATLGVGSVAGFFQVLRWVSQGRWIGGGDVKLGIGIGLLVGTPVLGGMVVFLASLLGSLAALPSIIRHKSGLKTKLAFGPFLIAATIIVFLFGQQLVDWYADTFIYIV